MLALPEVLIAIGAAAAAGGIVYRRLFLRPVNP